MTYSCEYWNAVGKGSEFCRWIGDNIDGVFFGNGSTRSLLDKYNLWQSIPKESAYVFKSNPEIYLDEVDYRYDDESQSYRAFTLLNTFRLGK